MFYSDDPATDFERHDAEQERKLEQLPICSCCDNPIQDDYFYQINDENICIHCLNEYFRKDVDDYVE